MDLSFPGQRTATATSCIPHDSVYMPGPRAGKSENGFFRCDTWLQIFQNDSKICEAEVTLTPLINKICKPCEVCYLDTNIKTGDVTTSFRISIYYKRDDFAFRTVNFPHMDSNIPANPAYGVYISQLVRYARICTSKVDFINRLRGLSLRLRQQGFETNRLQNSFNKFVNRHGFIVEKYGAALREMRLAIQA